MPAKTNLQDLDIDRAVALSQIDFQQGLVSEIEHNILTEWRNRRRSIENEMTRFSDLCDRWDGLYYPPDVLAVQGASHWAWHPSARTAGKSHVSINVPPVYVDIPASLQSVPPIENMLATTDSDDARMMATMAERLYRAWEEEIEIDMLTHQACVVKGLYGRTAAKVFWDPDSRFPHVTLVDQPRNLWLGWGQSDYKTLNWAAYVYRLTPESVYEEYGLQCVERPVGNATVPYVAPFIDGTQPSNRDWLNLMEGMVEVTDYWYRVPKGSPNGIGRVEHETWNAIIVGNRVVKNAPHREYKGKMPYVPLFNSYIPGVPDGRPELYDLEQLFREKDERMTGGSQLMNNTVNAQFWQLVGPEAPMTVTPGMKPIPNRVISPGAGNRIEAITPWMPEFQLEQFMVRIDRELSDASGLNDLLRGLAPSSTLSSSKAINALVANYEARIRMKRDLLYQWRKRLWKEAWSLWAEKDVAMRPVLRAPARLELVPPSLTPRDDAETSQIATNLKINKIWSGKRAMDRTGVDDPEQEENIIREEQTDATLNPAAVQVMAQLMAVLQQLGIQAQQSQQYAPAEEMAEQQAGSLANYRLLEGGQRGQPMMNGEGEQAQLPPEMQPANTPAGAEAAGAAEPVGTAQTMIQGGEAKSRILTQQQIGG